jgi:hypothetical protein
LSMVSTSSGELDPVFHAILEKATRICEANFGLLFRLDNGVVQTVVMPYERRVRTNNRDNLWRCSFSGVTGKCSADPWPTEDGNRSRNVEMWLIFVDADRGRNSFDGLFADFAQAVVVR